MEMLNIDESTSLITYIKNWAKLRSKKMFNQLILAGKNKITWEIDMRGIKGKSEFIGRLFAIKIL